MRWFRMYDEVVDDPKVQRLSGEMVKFWMNCLCLASKNNGYLPTIADICWKLRLSEDVVAEMIATLNECGLLDREGVTFTPHNWQKRQYKSDFSKGRTKKYRDRHGDGEQSDSETVTPPSQDRHSAVTVTPPEQIQNRTETEQKPRLVKREEHPVLRRVAEKMHERHPEIRRCPLSEVKAKLRAIVKSIPKDEWDLRLEGINQRHAAMCASHEWQKDGGQFAKGLDNWLAPTKGRFDIEPQVSLFGPTPTSNKPNPGLML